MLAVCWIDISLLIWRACIARAILASLDRTGILCIWRKTAIALEGCSAAESASVD